MTANGKREILPLTLKRNRVYILPTRFGVQFGFILLAMLLGSINYNNNLAFLLTFLLSGMALVSIVHTYRNLAGLTILSCRVDPVFAGETAMYEIAILKDSRAGGLSWSFRGGPSATIDVPEGQRQMVRIPFQTERRGYCNPGRLTVAGSYPFGLFRAWSVVHFGVPCLVYPRPLLMDQTHVYLDDSDQDGDERSLKKGSDDFDELKVYAPGDSLNRVAWKIFARGQGLFSKEFVDQQGRIVRIDWDSLPTADLEQKLSGLCSLVLQADKQSGPFILKMPGVVIGPDRGEAHRHRCLEALALYNGKGAEP